MTVSLDSQVVIKPDVLVNEVAGEAVILDLNSERYFGLDEVGTRMWSVLTTAPTVQAAYDTLLEEYEVEPERLKQDIDELLGKLADQGLVETRNA